MSGGNCSVLTPGQLGNFSLTATPDRRPPQVAGWREVEFDKVGATDRGGEGAVGRPGGGGARDGDL